MVDGQVDQIEEVFSLANNNCRWLMVGLAELVRNSICQLKSLTIDDRWLGHLV
jgi:hypothetical protein